MNNFKKEYLSEIKAILPIKSKRERIYLKKLSSDIEALIQEEHISSKKMLYDIYGIPSEVVHNYLSSLGIKTQTIGGITVQISPIVGLT